MIAQLITVPYVRAWSFATVPDARAIYRAIIDATVRPDATFDLGAFCALHEGRLPIVVVTAMHKEPPAEIQATIELLTAGQTRWEPTLDLVRAVIARRIRQLANEEGSVQPSGLRLVKHDSMYTMVDADGRDMKG